MPDMESTSRAKQIVAFVQAWLIRDRGITRREVCSNLGVSRQMLGRYLKAGDGGFSDSHRGPSSPELGFADRVERAIEEITWQRGGLTAILGTSPAASPEASALSRARELEIAELMQSEIPVRPIGQKLA